MLVSGQQDRMLRGADVWGNPVAYDKLGVRYRRWRNSVTAGRHEERREIENELRPMSAGELFRCAQRSTVWSHAHDQPSDIQQGLANPSGASENTAS